MNNIVNMASNDEGDLLYETDEKGQRVLVRSIESTQRVYLRFTNKTKRPVDIWWRDFQGNKQHYVRLESGLHYDMNSFITHPWEFTDVATNENYVVNNKPIFRAPQSIGGMMYRTNWNITIGVRSLKDTAMLVLASELRDCSEVNALDIPYFLVQELHTLINVIHDLQQPIAMG